MRHRSLEGEREEVVGWVEERVGQRGAGWLPGGGSGRPADISTRRGGLLPKVVHRTLRRRTHSL